LEQVKRHRSALLGALRAQQQLACKRGGVLIVSYTSRCSLNPTIQQS
jgi:hypothetical protein